MKQQIDVEQLLDRIELVQIVERAGAKLKKSGKGYRGACPLHGGEDPTAFHIYTGKDGRLRWHCHTECSAGDDAIDFVRRWHHLPEGPEGFLPAVRILAEYAGIPLADVGIDAEQARVESERRRAERARLDVMTLAARYYVRLLRSPAGEAGLAYARKRGWTDETIRELGLGYSDGGLLAYLREEDALSTTDASTSTSLSASLDLALETGLLTRREDGSLADTIPAGYLVYVHHLDRVVNYLSGRAAFTEDPEKKARNLKAPKQVYWALHNRTTPLLVVEGQACAITAWQWQLNAAALCGTQVYARQGRVEVEAVDVADTARAVLAQMALPAQAAGVALTLGSDCGPALVTGNPGELRTVLVNLVDNALRHAGGSRVEIDVRTTRRGKALSVRDDGHGLPPDLDARLLAEPLVRESNDPRGRWGFGFWMIAEIARRSGGRLAFGPGLDGKGLGVTITFKEEVTMKQRMHRIKERLLDALTPLAGLDHGARPVGRVD
jgi:anti-sigma regulatory factor (Ser/Thr protein kinase)